MPYIMAYSLQWYLIHAHVGPISVASTLPRLEHPACVCLRISYIIFPDNKWAPKSFQNPPSWRSKSFRIGPKRLLGELLGDPGPKMAPRGLQERKCTKNLNISTLHFGTVLGAKSIKNRSWADPIGHLFGVHPGQRC